VGLPKDEAGMASFAAAAQLEVAFRPLRHRVGESSMAMFGKMADAEMAPARLAALATNLHALLARVQRIVAVVREYPVAAELERAAGVGTPEAIAAFLDRAGRSLRRFEARMASLAALDAVASYFEGSWVVARRRAIERDQSNVAAISGIVDALPTLAAYQEFRIRASRLGGGQLAIFRMFRSKEGEIAKLNLNDMDLCLRRTIGREARLSWKLRMEAAAPEVLLDTDALGRKIQALTEADAAIRACNRDLLTDGIERHE
jgi:primosomal replication protein N''